MVAEPVNNNETMACTIVAVFVYFCDSRTKMIFQANRWAVLYFRDKSDVCPDGQVMLLVSLAVMFLLRKSDVLCSTHAPLRTSLARRANITPQGTSRSACGTHHSKNDKFLSKLVVFCWRRKRDSNPRTACNGYTISNRARSTSYAISPS